MPAWPGSPGRSDPLLGNSIISPMGADAIGDGSDVERPRYQRASKLRRFGAVGAGQGDAGRLCTPSGPTTRSTPVEVDHRHRRGRRGRRLHLARAPPTAGAAGPGPRRLRPRPAPRPRGPPRAARGRRRRPPCPRARWRRPRRRRCRRWPRRPRHRGERRGAPDRAASSRRSSVGSDSRASAQRFASSTGSPAVRIRAATHHIGPQPGWRSSRRRQAGRTAGASRTARSARAQAASAASTSGARPSGTGHVAETLDRMH